MNQKRADVVVVGGGIVGATAALYLAEEDVEVILVEQGKVGDGGASEAAAGILMDPDFVPPGTDYGEMESFARLNRAGYDYYPDYLNWLRAGTDEQLSLHDDGGLRIAVSDDTHEEHRRYHHEMERHEQPVRWLDSDELEQRVSPLRDVDMAGFYSERDAWVNPSAIMSALATACRQGKIDTHEETRAEAVRAQTDGAVVETVNGQQLLAERVLVAAGAWSPQLLDSVEYELPVQPRMGQMIRLRLPDQVHVPLIQFDDGFVVPRGDHYVDVGATMEPEAGYRSEGTEQGRSRLRSMAETVLDAGGWELVDQWAGIRPYADRKGGPFMGPIPGHEELFVCAGHYKNGITQGPISARIMADLLLGKEPPLPVDDYRL